MDYLHHPFASKRYTVFAKKGMVATSQPLAAQAGLEILQQGGNAIDAAIAAAAALTVVEPTSNGIGGDAFALVWTKGKLHGLNASGPAPALLTAEAVKRRGHEQMPKLGLVPITVPGVPAAWAELAEKFGRRPLTESLKPAIRYAEEGYPLTPILGKYWARAYQAYRKQEGPEFEAWFHTFAPQGRAPEIGEVWSSKGHAESLRRIAASEARDFYEGELAQRIDDFMVEHGGFLRKSDLSAYRPEWVEPISANYRGYEVWEIPPNGQGMVALMALNIYEQLGQPEWLFAETVHRQIEALKLAFTDGQAWITEPADMPVSTEYLLSREYASLRTQEICDTALDPKPMDLPKGGTAAKSFGGIRKPACWPAGRNPGRTA